MTTKQLILECALIELERKGIDRFSLRAVSTEAGLTPMAIYRHFKNKDDLLAAAGEEAFDKWRRRIERIKDTDPISWFRKCMRAYVEFALDDPARFDVCFVLKTQVERLYPDDFVGGKSPVIATTVERIRKGQHAGILAPGDALELALFVWAQLHGLVMLHRAGRFAMKRADFLALCKRCGEHTLHTLSV